MSIRRSFLIAFAVVLLALASSLAINWPTNVFTGQSVTARQTQKDLALPLPQGWAFFTKSPQDPSLVMYRSTASGTWTRADTLPQSSSANLFGLSRNQRAQPTEYAYIGSRVRFTACDDYLTACLDRPLGVAQLVQNPTRSQHFCGHFRLVTQVPVKWSYRNLVPEEIRAVQVANVEVTCRPTP